MLGLGTVGVVKVTPDGAVIADDPHAATAAGDGNRFPFHVLVSPLPLVLMAVLGRFR